MGPMDSSACFTFQSSSELKKTLTVKEIKIDDQIRDLIKHALRVQNFTFFFLWNYKPHLIVTAPLDP